MNDIQQETRKIWDDMKAEEECAECKLIREEYKGFGPRHDGSRFCESGSIASGGNHAHCTCDWCF